MIPNLHIYKMKYNLKNVPPHHSQTHRSVVSGHFSQKRLWVMYVMEKTSHLMYIMHLTNMSCMYIMHLTNMLCMYSMHLTNMQFMYSMHLTNMLCMYSMHITNMLCMYTMHINNMSCMNSKWHAYSTTSRVHPPTAGPKTRCGVNSFASARRDVDTCI